ncbi:MAG TPA: hypothetical protein VKV04_14245 [Verrucomicrobiae bacterium]|nr:hypothetical protein [Verrucomicrobiae bacterium]
MTPWPFNDPPNVAVFTSKKILDDNDWIQTVTHDEDDGAWQFHPYGGTVESDAKVVSLKTITQIDPSVLELADLPLGWCAWRSTKEGQWKRDRRPPDS